MQVKLNYFCQNYWINSSILPFWLWTFGIDPVLTSIQMLQLCNIWLYINHEITNTREVQAPTILVHSCVQAIIYKATMIWFRHRYLNYVYYKNPDFGLKKLILNFVKLATRGVVPVIIPLYVHGLVQERRNSITNALTHRYYCVNHTQVHMKIFSVALYWPKVFLFTIDHRLCSWCILTIIHEAIIYLTPFCSIIQVDHHIHSHPIHFHSIICITCLFCYLDIFMILSFQRAKWTEYNGFFITIDKTRPHPLNSEKGKWDIDFFS